MFMEVLNHKTKSDSSPNIILNEEKDENVKHISSSNSESLVDNLQRNMQRCEQMKRKKEENTPLIDFETGINNSDCASNSNESQSDEPIVEMNHKHTHTRYSEAFNLNVPSKQYKDEDDQFDNINIVNEDEDSLIKGENEVTTANTNENNVEVIVSDLECDLNEEDSNEEDNPIVNNAAKTNSTLIAITKATRAQNSFIKINNKLKTALEANNSDKKTCSYMMALGGGEDSKMNYEVDSIIEEEDELNHFNEEKADEVKEEPLKIVIPKHKSSRSEMINIQSTIDKIQERIDKEREDKLNQKKLIKNNLIELFSQQFDIDEEDNDKEINISNNSLIGDNEDEKSFKKLNTFSSNLSSSINMNQIIFNSNIRRMKTMSYEISTPITFSFVSIDKKLINPSHLVHCKTLSFQKPFHIPSKLQLNQTKKKPIIKHTHNNSHQCSLLLHDMRKKILLNKGKAQSLYLKKTAISEENIVTNTPSIKKSTLRKRIKSGLTFSTKLSNDKSTIISTCCKTLPNEINVNSDNISNRKYICDCLSGMHFPLSSINHQRIAIDKVKKSKMNMFAIMISKENEFKALYEIKKNCLNRIYSIIRVSEIIDKDMMNNSLMTIYKYDKGKFSFVNVGDHINFIKGFYGNIIAFSLNERIPMKMHSNNI